MAEEQSNIPQQQAVQTQGCPGDCKMCPREQQTYCASQIGYNTIHAIAGMQTILSGLAETVGRLTETVGGMQTMLSGLAETVGRLSDTLDRMQAEVGARNAAPVLIEAPKAEPETLEYSEQTKKSVSKKKQK